MHDIIKTRQTYKAADGYFVCDIKSDPFMHAGVRQNSEEVWIYPVDEMWIKTMQNRSYFPKEAELGQCDYGTPFLDAV